jgi:hypothetical protein
MRVLYRSAAAALVLCLAISCDNSIGIFKTVQDEVAQKGNDLFVKTQVTNAFRLGSNYYASTATLNRRDVSSANAWSKVSINGISSYFLRGALLAGNSTSGTIYVLLDNNDSGAVEAYSSSDGSTWTKLNSSGLSNPDALYTANGQLFAQNHFISSATPATSSYTLYHYNATTPGFELVQNFAPATDKTIRGVAYDGTNYWFASEDKLGFDTTPNASSTATAPTDATGSGQLFAGLSGTIWGISYSGGHLYLSTKEGSLYQDALASSQKVASIPLTVAIAGLPAPSGPIMLVGTDATTDGYTATTASGYYEGSFGSLVVGSTNNIVSSTSADYTTTVSSFPVHAFFYDGDASSGTLFICVSPGTTSKSYYGLYASTWNKDPTIPPNTWSGWKAE